MLPSAASLRQTGGRELERIVFDEATIARRVRELGQEITAVYPSGELLVLGLLKGSFIFLSDLCAASSGRYRSTSSSPRATAPIRCPAATSGCCTIRRRSCGVSTSSWWKTSSTPGRR